MALMDQNLVLSSAQAITISAISTFAYDILNGAPLATAGGVYAVPSGQIIGVNQTFFGEDLGLGRGLGTPQVEVYTGAGTPSGGTSLQIALQGAPDNGGGTIAGLTFVPYIQTRGIPLASILASSKIARFDLPSRESGQALPRFLNLAYTVVGGPFAGLTVNSYINIGSGTAQGTIQAYAANY